MRTRVSQKAFLAFTAALLMLSTGVQSPAAAPAKKQAAFNMLPMVATSVVESNGQLVVNGLVGTTPFQTPLVLTPGAVPAGGTCPVLNLSLGPIHLSLLGLNVDTSSVCLQVTAIQNGGLLGDLLCGIANLLNSGFTLSEALATLTPDRLQILTAGLTQIVNQAIFIPLTRSDAVTAASCSVLHLELGPLDLNLLGLRVQLNDCNAGPVVLDVTATQNGGLLGNLLCSLSGQNAAAKIASLLESIATALNNLLG